MTRVELPDVTKPHALRSRFVSAVEALDGFLRRRQGVIEYSGSRDCIFRLQVIRNDDYFFLSDGTWLRAGDRMIDLHLWNEHVPQMPDGRPTLAFARRIDRCIDVSLAELSRYLSQRPDLDDITAIRGNMSLGAKARGDQIARIAARFGFERVPPSGPLTLGERLHRFGENILISMLVMAHNSSALRLDTLWRDRTLTYLSRAVLTERYAPRASSEKG